MKAFLIIIVSILFALVLKAIDYFTNRENIKSVGAKSNKESRDMPKIDITNEEELKKALEYYKGLPD